MKIEILLIEQSLQNPNRQTVQSCIPNLNFPCYKTLLQINPGTIIQLYIAINKQAQNYRAIVIHASCTKRCGLLKSRGEKSSGNQCG